MKKVMLIYGWSGSLPPHWQDWLVRELAGRHHMVWLPKLPKRYSPKKHQWTNKLSRHLEAMRPDTVVCHSLGCIAWLHLCNEELILPVKRLLLVAPPSLTTEGIQDIKTFFPCRVPTSLHAEEAHLVTSTNDHYMTPEEAKAFAQTLKLTHTVLEGQGHLNSDSGYGPWPWVLEWVENRSSELNKDVEEE